MSGQAAGESEISRLLKVYSRSMQEDILSRVPSNLLISVPTPLTKALTAEQLMSETSNEDTTLLRNDQIEYTTPAYLKAVCLFVIVLIEFGYHYSENTFSTLKSAIKENFQIDNFQYGIFQSSSSLVASILPFLGGVLLENFGIQHGCLLATSFLALSSILIACSFLIKEFYLLVLGKAIFGFGTCLFVQLRLPILGEWFKGSNLLIALSVASFFSRLGAFLAMATPYPLAALLNSYSAALWVSVIIGLLMISTQLGFMKTIKFSHFSGMTREPTTFRFSRLLYLPLQLWCIIIVYSTLGASSSAFLHFHTEFVQLRFGISPISSGAIASTSQILPLILSPFFVFFQKDFGGQLYLLSLSSMSFTLAMVFLGFSPANPLIGLSVFSMSLLFGSASLSILLPILVSQEGLGTAFGLCTSAFHVSLGLQDLALGLLQSQNYSLKSQVYDSTMGFLVIVGLIAIMFSLLAFVLDYLYGDSRLNSSINTREKLLLAQARSPTSIGPSARFYMRTKRGNQIAISFLCLVGLSYFMLFFYSL